MLRSATYRSRREYGIKVFIGDLTVQSGKDEADINTIVRRFGVTGTAPQNIRAPLLNDFDGIFDFQSAMNAMTDARNSFMALDADTRARFNNDPHRFVNFCSEVDDKGDLVNLAEMRKIGLAVPAAPPPEVPPPMRVEVVNPAPVA